MQHISARCSLVWTGTLVSPALYCEFVIAHGGCKEWNGLTFFKHLVLSSFTVSHSYGYGLLDAGAMVAMAQNWTTVGPQHQCVHTILEEPRLEQL